jgi:superfamily II DNA or RNA helicase
VQIKVHLSQKERERYDRLIQTRNAFLQEANIYLSSAQGWQRFVQASARSKAGRRAMLAHREAKAIAFGTEGKLRVLADLLANHYPERSLIFTDDNATVYRISQEFLIPAITHQTGVKERHDVLQRFKQGEYRALVASRVLNEGVDVPEASVAIVLSGTGSTREYIQRLGRVLRKGKDPTKLALLYEVVAEDTSEENVSRRRRGTKSPPKSNQLELVPSPSPYSVTPKTTPRAAEAEAEWGSSVEEMPD